MGSQEVGWQLFLEERPVYSKSSEMKECGIPGWLGYYLDLQQITFILNSFCNCGSLIKTINWIFYLKAIPFLPNNEFPVILTPNQIIHHFHTWLSLNWNEPYNGFCLLVCFSDQEVEDESLPSLWNKFLGKLQVSRMSGFNC